MKSASAARRIALETLYSCDSLGDWSEDKISLCLKQFWQDQDSRVDSAPEEAFATAIRLIHEVIAKREEIDSLIKKTSEHWSLERMSRIDRNVLRIAVLELLLSPELPYKVVINEAIEVAKDYSGPESAPFVNGVLDHIAKDLGLHPVISEKAS